MASWGSAIQHRCRVPDKLTKAQDLLHVAVAAVSDAFGAINGQALPCWQVTRSGSSLLLGIDFL